MVFQQQIYRHTTANINLRNLIHNFKQLKKIVPEQNFFCPMVKANAYGHGDIEVALCLENEGVSCLGVGLVEEGLLLRKMGVRAKLLVFAIFDKEAVHEIYKYNLTPVISTWQQLELLTQPISVHLKFDTGMHRLGFDWLEANQLLNYIQQKKSFLKVEGILTHLHSAEDAESETGKSIAQLKNFFEVEKIFAKLKPISHSLNSAGMIAFYNSEKANKVAGVISQQQGVRPGLALYGYQPMSTSSVALDLRPVMSLRSHIIKFHQLRSGEGVSYNQTWQAIRKSLVGIVPIGYADGYHRNLSNQAEVLVDGRKAKVVGNVCMDYLTIDVTDIFDSIPQREVEVTLFGYDSKDNFISASELATKGDTITWEILTSISERVPRVYTGKEER